ncbi:retrovirus-related pol polyprotein from transposon TNT 1-94 [Tanacetum coccineum]
MSNPTSKPSNASPVKIEAPKELPKVSLVKESLKKLKFHLSRFDNVVKIRTTPDTHTKDLLNEIMEVQTIFDQMDAVVQQSSVDKQCLEIAKKELLLENDRLLQQIMSQDVLLTMMNSMSLNGESVNMERKRNESCDKCFNLDAELLKSQNAHNDLLKSYSQLEKHCISLELSIQLNQEIFQKHESCDNQNALEIPEFFENNDLKAQLQDKDTTICKLKKIIKSMREKSKEENVNYDYCEIETKNVELENNLRKVKGKEIVDIAAQIPSTNTIIPGMFKLDLEPLAPRLLQNREAHIDYLKYTHEIANILWGIVEQAKANQPLDNELDFACKHAQRIQELLVYVRDTSPNAIKLNAKKVAITPKNNVRKLGLKCSTSNCGCKPTGNKKNDRISRTPSRNMKNKVEAQPMKVNKKNRVVEPIRDVDVKHSFKANSELICTTCKKSMFDGVHDMCLLDFVENVNSRAKSAKKHKKQNIWKPTANVVPPKKTTSHSVETQKPELKVYSRKPKNIKNVGPSKKAKIVESKNANHFEPNHTWGSNATDIPSSSSLAMTGCPYCSQGIVRFGNDHIARIMGYGDYQLGNVTISRVYYVEGLGHNLFSVGQFCDADLELAKDGLARGILRLKFQKDHLCSACALGKSKKSSHQPKAEDTNQEKLYLFHMDLCGPTCVASINGKMYILVIIDDYSRFTWVRFLRTKDEAPEAIIKCIKNIQVRLNVILMQDKKQDLSFFHVFGALCYPTTNNDDLGKLDAKADIGIFVGYVPAKKAFRIYNKKTWKIIETIHVTFDELTVMASEQFSSGLGLHSLTHATSSSGLVPNTVFQQPCISPNRDDWDHLFQPMFDEYFNPPSIVVSPVQEAAAPRVVVLADSPVSTSIDQDAPSTSIPST